MREREKLRMGKKRKQKRDRKKEGIERQWGTGKKQRVKELERGGER